MSGVLSWVDVRHRTETGQGIGLEDTMPILEDVAKLVIESAPRALCDDCIAGKLPPPTRDHASHMTRQLGKSLSFDRRVDTCASCGATKLVILSTQGTQSGLT